MRQTRHAGSPARAAQRRPRNPRPGERARTQPIAPPRRWRDFLWTLRSIVSSARRQCLPADRFPAPAWSGSPASPASPNPRFSNMFTLDSRRAFVSHSGVGPRRSFQPPMDITLEQWDNAFDSQAKAFLVGVREAAPLMGRGSRIFAITYAEGSRTGSLQPWVGMGSAKAALESLVRYFAVSLARRGITVNAISPGWTEDSVLNTLPPQAQELIRKWHQRGWTPMGRLGTPEDIGKVVALFCSEEAGWVTGQVIY